MYGNIRSAVMGSINMDFIMTMDRMPECGENLVGKSYGYANGGKGANQASALAKLGACTKMLGKVADDENGKILLNSLEKKGVDISLVSTTGTQTGLAVIMLDKTGKNRIVVYEGANAEIEPSDFIQGIDDELDLMLVQFETNEDAVVACINKAKEKGAVTVVDCGPAKEFALEKMQGATIVTPNESETKVLTGVYPGTEDEIKKASEILMERSKAKFIVLKLGERGCSVFDGSEMKIMPPYKSKVADTTSAGDCFTAAMALEYVRTDDIYAACDMGNRAGAVAVSRMGADSSMPDYNDLISISDVCIER